MRRRSRHIARFSLVAASALVWSGCGGMPGGHSLDGLDHSEHNHNHAGHVHHGEPSRVDVPGDEHYHHDANSAHTHVGPNGGRLVVLGDEDYHAEVLIDHRNAEVTILILDRNGRKPVRVDQDAITLNFKCQGQPHQIRLLAVAPAADQAGSSRFVGQSDLLRGDCDLNGRLNVIIAGKAYTGRVAHNEDDHKLVR